MEARKGHIQIDLHDVFEAGSIEEAIVEWCRQSLTTSSGVVGPTFATSGPGSGWSKKFGAEDFALCALKEGAAHYVNEHDGRMLSALPVDEDEDDEGDDEDIETDIGGCRYRVGDWTEESVVRIEVPDIEDAIRHPNEVAEMAKAVISHHHSYSDCDEWKDLVLRVQRLAEALDEIDPDDFD